MTTPATELRDRIRRAICEASGFTWLPDELMEPDEYGEHADAVLAVLPETVVARQVLGTPTTDPAPNDRLRKAAQRALESLNDLIADTTDPGVEALGARHELGQALLNTSLAAPSAPAAPALEPQDHPGADLFVALQAAGLDADEAHRRMYAYAGMVLRQEKATASAPAAPADRATDRRDRYAAAIRDNDGWVLDGGQHMLDAVMAVADAEQAVLASTLREVLDTFGPMHDVYGGPVSYYDGSADITPAQYEGWRAVLDGVPRRLANEAQPETEGFREWLRRQPVGNQPITLMAPVPLTLAPDATATTEDDDPICGDQYDGEACELEPEHPGAHCAGIACWDYGRAPATAATEEPQP